MARTSGARMLGNVVGALKSPTQNPYRKTRHGSKHRKAWADGKRAALLEGKSQYRKEYAP